MTRAPALEDALVTVADYAAAQAWFAENGYGDGLPVIPPTPDLVEAMIGAGGRPAAELLGRVGGRAEGITAGQAAVCAVLAGCRPEYFPVVLATWDAVLDPAFNAVSVLGSSGGTAITAVVSGPYAEVIGMNSGHNLFGPGNQANATIGRAVRLGVMDVLDYRTGLLDGAAFGNQARFGAHFAESPPPASWRPLHERLGHPDASTVTVAVTDAPRQVTHILSGNADNILKMFAHSMRDLSHCGAGRGLAYFIVVGPEHAGILAEAGWTPERIAEHLAEASRFTPAELQAAGVPLAENGLPVEEGRRMTLRADGTLPAADASEIFVVSAGGTGAGWSAVIYGYAPTQVYRPVTTPIRLP
jgi:hypothetical protein